MLRKLWVSLFSAQLVVAAGLFFTSPEATAQRAAESSGEQQQTRRTPAMRESVYQRLAKAQECAENDDIACAEKELQEIGRIRDLNSYEAAQRHYFYGFIYLNSENYAKAIEAYEQVLEQPDLPISLEQDTMLALAQLYVQEERLH